MGDWMELAIPAAAAAVALAALLATVAYRRRSEHKRDFQVLLERSDRAAEEWRERFDRESEKREQATQALIERIDREAAKREEQIDREAAKRERASQAALERSDRNFEALLARSNELAKGLAGVGERTARNEAALEAITVGKRGPAAQSLSAAEEAGTVAAQQIPDEPPPE